MQNLSEYPVVANKPIPQVIGILRRNIVCLISSKNNYSTVLYKEKGEKGGVKRVCCVISPCNYF